MAFITDPVLQSNSVQARAATDLAIVQGTSVNCPWIEVAPATKGTGQYTLGSGGRIYSTAFSRNFSFWCQDLVFDVSFVITPDTGTSRFRMGLIGSTVSIFNAPSALEVSLRSDNRVTVGVKENAGNTNISTFIIDQTPAYTILRVRLTLRKNAWSVGATGSEIELTLYDSSGERDTYTGSHGLDKDLWNTGAKDVDDIGDAHARLCFELATAGGADSVVISDCSVAFANQAQTAPTVFGPIRDGMSMELPDIDAADQPGMVDGFIDCTLAPFSCDATGAVDCSDAFIECMDVCKDYSLTLFIPAGAILKVSKELNSRQMSYQRSNSTAGNRQSFTDEAKPVNILGSNAGTKPIIKLADASTGFGDGTNRASAKVLLVFDTTDYKNEPPSGSVLNANYNQAITNVSFDLGDNAGAIAIDAQGAQGVEILLCDVYSSDAGAEPRFFAGMSNLPGSGGAVSSLDVVGGKHALYMSTSQPAPMLSGLTCSGQTVSPIYIASTGNRHTLNLLGCDMTVTAGLTAIDASSVPVTETTGNASRGYIQLEDCSVQWSAYNAANVLLDCTRPANILRTWVKDCATIIEHPSTTITERATGWDELDEFVVSVNAPGLDTTALNVDLATAVVEAIDDPLQYLAGSYVDNVLTTADIKTYGTVGIAPASTLTSKWRIPADFPNWENANIDVAVDYSEDPNGVDTNTGLVTAAAAAVAGDIVFLRRGYWTVADTLTWAAGVRVVGAGKYFTYVTTVKQPGASAPFGSSDTPRPVVQTASSALGSVHAFYCIQFPKSTPKGYALNWRCAGKTFGLTTRRQNVYGFGTYTGTTDYTTTTPNVKFSELAGNSTHWHHYQGNPFDTADPYCHFIFENITGRIDHVHLNSEHVDSMPGQVMIDNCADVRIHGFKGEGQYPMIYAKDSASVEITGPGGNPSAFIPDGSVPTGEVAGTAQAGTGYGPVPGGYPTGLTPTLFILENVTNARITMPYDECRNSGASTAQVFGQGVRADFWHLINIVDDDGTTETSLIPVLSRPALFKIGSPGSVVATPKGGSLRRKANKRRHYVVEIDGRLYRANSVVEANVILEQARELAEDASPAPRDDAEYARELLSRFKVPKIRNNSL